MRAEWRLAFAAGLLAGAATGLWWQLPWWSVLVPAGLAVAAWAARGDPWLRARMLIALAACRAARRAGGEDLPAGQLTRLDVQEQIARAVLDAGSRAERAAALEAGAVFLEAVWDR